MTIFFGLHIGYLITRDDYGINIGWGQNIGRKRGEALFRWEKTIVFPWWVQRRHIRQALFVAKCRRIQRRSDRAKRGSAT